MRRQRLSPRSSLGQSPQGGGTPRKGVPLPQSHGEQGARWGTASHVVISAFTGGRQVETDPVIWQSDRISKVNASFCCRAPLRASRHRPAFYREAQRFGRNCSIPTQPPGYITLHAYPPRGSAFYFPGPRRKIVPWPSPDSRHRIGDLDDRDHKRHLPPRFRRDRPRRFCSVLRF